MDSQCCARQAQQSTHCAMCRWAKGLGAFINLESTGASGPDVLFQHTGAWTLRAYARAAKHPHASCLAQVLESRHRLQQTDQGGHALTLMKGAPTA